MPMSKRKTFKRILLASLALLASPSNLSAQAPIVSPASLGQASSYAEEASQRASEYNRYYTSAYEASTETDVLSTPSVIQTGAENAVANQSSGYFDSIDSTCCDTLGSVGECSKAECCVPWWAHRNSAYGEFLLLSAGNSDIMYAREETDPLLQGTPTGPTGILQDTASAGFRVGASIARDNCSSIFGAFTQWEGGSASTITRSGATNILNPVLLHPSLLTTGSTAITASAQQRIAFRLADMGYRRVYRSGANHVINWSAGLRYGKLEQQLNTSQIVGVATGLTNMITGVDYDGFGLLAGLDAERQSQETGLLVYGKVGASMMAGNWRARSRQTNQFGGGVAANEYRDFRLSPILESELGTGWQSESGGLRLTAGFLASGWFNAISTRDYIQSFNEGNFVDMNDTVTFSGLTARIEIRR